MHPSSAALIRFCVLAVLIGVAIWAVGQSTIDRAVYTIIRVVLIVAVVLLALQTFGLLAF